MPFALPAAAQEEGLGLRGSTDEGGSVEDSGPTAILLRPRIRGSVDQAAGQPAAPVLPKQDAVRAAPPVQPSAEIVVAPIAGRSERSASPAPTASDDLDEASTGTVPAKTVDAETDLTVDKGAERTKPIEGLDREEEGNPFDAPGIHVGTFLIKPTLEQGLTATNNADSSAGGKPALLSETTLRVNGVSDWEIGLATFDAYGTLRRSLAGDDVNDYEAGASGRIEAELGKDWRRITAGSVTIRPESATSPVQIEGATEEPLRTTLAGSGTLEKAVGKARLAATASIERNIYGDADLEGGGVLSQKERNATLYTLKLRAGYEVSPALTPFVETEIGRRRYDLTEDSAGYRRSSERLALRAGLAVDLGEKFSGEVAAGWLRETFDDDRLADIDGPSVEAKLNWSPVRGTIVSLTGSTALEGTTTPGESGSILWQGQLSAERQMRSNLTGKASAGLGYRDYAGCDCYDVILNADVSLTWWLNRYAGLTVRARHESVRGNIPDRDSHAESIFLGLKLQR